MDDSEKAPTSSEFRDLLQAIARFIHNPTLSNLRNWAAVREGSALGNRGYCHPFGDYSSHHGLSCWTGKRSISELDAGDEGRICPAFDSGFAFCKLRRRTLHEDDLPKVLKVAMELMAAYSARFPDLNLGDYDERDGAE